MKHEVRITKYMRLVWGNHFKLRSRLWNILNNARKFRLNFNLEDIGETIDDLNKIKGIEGKLIREVYKVNCST